LITDFYAYNTNQADTSTVGLHWVGDLALDVRLESLSAAGAVTLELVEGGRLFRCDLDVATGQATLSIDGVEDLRPVAQTSFRGAAEHRVLFANADDELRLWIDGDLAEFDAPTIYNGQELGANVPTREDLTPARIGVRGGEFRASSLRLLRDIYYIADRADPRGPDRPTSAYEYETISDLIRLGPEGISELLADPEKFSRFTLPKSVDFKLEADQFLMLGDNSPRSSDSRLWRPNEHFVHRDLLAGKAFYIYWPHGLDHLPGTDIWVPLFPNFARMRLVR
jgi:signal peptidase I